MALVDNAWYVNFGNGTSTGYYAVTAWATGVVTAAGTIVRQLAAPAVGSERVFVCVVAGTTHATTEPTWVLTRGAKTTDNTVTWQECTGVAALNGDATNTPSWTITATPPGGVKNTVVTLGQVIKRDAGTSYQICTTTGTAGNGAEPAFSNTAGTTTNDNTVVWTSLGVVGNFTGWQAPHARGTNALTATWAQAGNKVFVGDNHAETQTTASTWTGAGTLANPILIYCVDHTAAVPPTSANLMTTATVTNTGANVFGPILGGAFYIYGITFDSGGGGATSNALQISGGWIKLDTCNLFKTGTTANAGGVATTSSLLEMINTTVKFGNTGDGFRIQSSNLIWKNTASAIAGATLPTVLMTQNGVGTARIIGVDFSALAAGKTLVGATATNTPVIYTFVDCKLGASVTVAATPQAPGPLIDLIRCDSGATNYRDERYNYVGTQTVDTTIVRTGGASDGTTTVAWKFVSTANSRWVLPFEAQPIAIWNDSTSAITTLTIYGTTTGGGVPNNDDIWVEVEYLGSSTTPQGSFITTTKTDNLAPSTTTNNSADGSTWGGGGAGNGFKIVVPSFTPGMKGPLNITVKVAKASTTYYIDPKVSI